jgi:proteasome lid subunit RPN8/RPN11
MELDPKTKDRIKRHADKSSPEECCGFLIESEEGALKSIECKNMASDKKNFFKISVDEYLDALVEGDILAVYHSHTTEEEQSFSEVDKTVCRDLEIISVLYNTATEKFKILEPDDDE